MGKGFLGRYTSTGVNFQTLAQEINELFVVCFQTALHVRLLWNIHLCDASLLSLLLVLSSLLKSFLE